MSPSDWLISRGAGEPAKPAFMDRLTLGASAGGGGCWAMTYPLFFMMGCALAAFCTASKTRL